MLNISSRARSLLAAVLILASPLVHAGPWAEVGDSALRSDIETLANAGVISDLTMQWPLPWDRILSRLTHDKSLADQPSWVQDAAMRLQARAMVELSPDAVNVSGWIDGTNAPDVVRDFDALGRQNAQGQASYEWKGDTTTVRLNVGGQSHDRLDNQTVMLDGTYIAHQFDGAAVYAGWLTHWWGPGWISALSESNNARPIPQIGINRLGSEPFETKWLHWLGPWQAEFFVGVLDGPRLARNTILDGLSVSFNPLPGFQWGFERLDEACGSGHPCDLPKSWFDPQNNAQHPSKTNDELDLDFKYTHDIGDVTLSAYMQLMNEDSNPFWHSDTSHLFGLTAWAAVAGTRVRFTAEFTDTVPTANMFSFGDYAYGAAYNDYKYTDGMRYRGLATGFSLDSDSKLLTLQAAWTGWYDINWTVSYHHALVADMHAYGDVAPGGGFVGATFNPLSTSSVIMNIGEARASFPLGRSFTVDTSVRYQTDQLRPAHGGEAAVEARLSYKLQD